MNERMRMRIIARCIIEWREDSVAINSEASGVCPVRALRPL